MPEDIRLQLTTSSFEDLRALAKTADELWQAREQSSVVFASNTRVTRTVRPRPVTTTSSDESSARGRDVYYYHRHFGDAARKCNSPCAYVGNDRVIIIIIIFHTVQDTFSVYCVPGSTPVPQNPMNAMVMVMVKLILNATSPYPSPLHPRPSPLTPFPHPSYRAAKAHSMRA